MLEFGNYYLKWYDKSYGVRQNEIPELKRFPKNITPHLSVIYHLLNSLENKRPNDNYCAYRQLSPDIHLSHSNRNRLIRYDLHMMLDGSTFIDRTEKIEIINEEINEISKRVNEYCMDNVYSSLSARWKLGQLVFNRLGTPGIKE